MRSEQDSANGGRRGAVAILSVAVILIAVLLLALIAKPSPVDDVAAAAPDIATPAGAGDTHTPTEIPPFYNVPEVPDPPAPAGTFMKSEEIPGAPASLKAYRIMYHSQNNDDSDTSVSGIFALPTTPPPPGGFPVIAFAHGTTGINQRCGISLSPFEKNTPSFSTFIMEIEPLVKAGYAVAGTDYLGEGAPGTPSYLVGKVEGQDVLNSVRAVHSWRDDLNENQTIIWGHSQGGHSASFAAQMASSYAPDLNIQGAAVLAPGLLPVLPVAVEALLSNTEPSGQTGFVMLIAGSWTRMYPDDLAPEDLLTPLGLESLQKVDTLCGSDEGDAYMSQPMSAYLKNPLPAEFYALAALNTPGNTRINMPLNLTQGLKDTTIIPQLTLGYNLLLCQYNNVVDWRIYPNDTHAGVMVNSREFINDWMADRLAGQPPPNSCTNQ